MRWVRFLDEEGRVCWGNLRDPVTAERTEVPPWISPSRTGPVVRIDRLLAPVEPPNILAIGLNYADHAAEGGRTVPEEPVIFIKATSAVIGPREPILLPISAPAEVDFEAELVVVIGKSARNVPAGEARGYVAGYTCGNDVSARDCQRRRDKQWARAKSFDTFAPIGPWLVTPDEFDPDDVEVQSELNGVVMQKASTRSMIFSCDELIGYLSKQFTLLPGTAIFTGTPAGVGFARTPPVYLRSGDTITVTIAGIGSLTNPVVEAR